MLYFFEDYAFDTARRELRRGATVLPVEPQIFDLLAYLIANRERVVSKEDLLAAVWEGRIVSESTLSSSINAVRTVIGDNGEDQRLIRTLPRKGFRFVGAVTQQEAPARPVIDAPGSAGAPFPPASDPYPGQLESMEPSAARRPPVADSRRAGLVSRKTFLISTGAGLLAIAATLLFFLWPESEPSRRAPVASAPKFDASTVPLIDDEARRSLASYPTRPDFKALAITGEGMSVAEGEADAEAAKRDALRRCTARTKRQCRLYAVGNDVVWSGEAMPLPAPSDLRVEPLDIRLVPGEIPTLDREWRERIARLHMKAPNHKALAVTFRAYWIVGSRATRAEATRLALEACSEHAQRPCLILAVDGFLTMQIPKSRPAVNIFIPSREAELAGDLERISKIYQGPEWRALARGKNGSWHAIAGAASEDAAVAAVLQSCSQADQECRLYAIGNFRVPGE